MLVSLNNSGDPVEKTSRHALVKDDVNRGPLAKIIRCGGLDCDHNTMLQNSDGGRRRDGFFVSAGERTAT